MKPMFALRHFASAPSLIVETSRSPTTIRPEVGRSMPAMRFRSVVLPEPEGPMSAMKSPSSTVSDRLSSTVRTWVSRVYCFTSESMRMREVAELMRLSFWSVLLDADLLLRAPGMRGRGGVGDDLLAAREARRRLHLRARGGAERQRLERGLAVRDEEDALLASHLRDGGRRHHHLRPRLLVDLRLRVQEHHPARHFGEHLRVLGEELDLHLDRALLAVGRRDDLPEPRLVGLVRIRVQRDLRGLPEDELPDVLLVDVGFHLERGEVHDDRERRAGGARPAVALGRDGLSEKRLLHGDDAVDRRVDLGVLDLLLEVAGLGFVRRNLGLERLHLGIRRVEGLLRSD